MLCRISILNECIPCKRTGDEGDILFIGESPGHTENRTKKQFSGKAGKHLRKFIRMYKLENVSQFTTVIKCQPPRNRNPFPEEVDNCAKYLVEDIETIDPKIIVCVGSIAAKVFTNNPRFSLGKNVNKPFNYGKLIIIPIYHPSYIIKEGMTDSYLKSFNMISDFYNTMNPYYSKRKYKLKTRK